MNSNDIFIPLKAMAEVVAQYQADHGIALSIGPVRHYRQITVDVSVAPIEGECSEHRKIGHYVPADGRFVVTDMDLATDKVPGLGGALADFGIVWCKA